VAKKRIVTPDENAESLRTLAIEAVREFADYIDGWSHEDLLAVINRRPSSNYSGELDKATRAMFLWELHRRTTGGAPLESRVVS
jgi:hypothetical protein